MAAEQRDYDDEDDEDDEEAVGKRRPLPRGEKHQRHWRRTVTVVGLPWSRHAFDAAGGAGARAALSGMLLWLELLGSRGTTTTATVVPQGGI